MLQDSGVPRHEGRSDKPEYLPKGEIPGHNRQDHPERLVVDVALGSIRGDGNVGEHLLGVGGVVPANPGTFLGFGPPGRDGLSHLHRHQASEIVLALLQQITRPLHQLRPLFEANPAPFRERGVGGLDPAVDLGRGMRLVFGDDLTVGGINRFH